MEPRTGCLLSWNCECMRGDVVDIEIDSGDEVSCLPSNTGADTYPLHVEVTTLRLVAVSCMSSVQEFWVWKLMTCVATW